MEIFILSSKIQIIIMIIFNIFIYLFIIYLPLFNDIVSCLVYITLKGVVINEKLEELERKRVWLIYE
jgi:hypothetical protein